MRLPIWIAKHGLDYSKFAKLIKVSPAAVERYCLAFGHRRFREPKRAVKLKIFRTTNGQVSPNDFYNLPVLRAACRSAREASARPSRAARGGGRSYTPAATLSRRKADGHGPGRRS